MPAPLNISAVGSVYYKINKEKKCYDILYHDVIIKIKYKGK